MVISFTNPYLSSNLPTIASVYSTSSSQNPLALTPNIQNDATAWLNPIGNITSLINTNSLYTSFIQTSMDKYINSMQETAWALISNILQNYEVPKIDINQLLSQMISSYENTDIGGQLDGEISTFNYDIKNLKSKWQKKKPHLSEKFYQRVIEISKNIGCDPNDLMAVMNGESGISSTAVNKSTNATGLIQFMPATAKSLGTTTAQLKNMSPEKQLDYVEKYLKQMKKSAGIANNKKINAGQLYALVFLPGRANQNVLTTGNEAYYKYNKGLDINGDKKITMTELNQRVKNFMA